MAFSIMRADTHRLAHRIAPFLAALALFMVAIGAWAWAWSTGGRAEADDPTIDLVAIDADSTGNTATSLGPLDDCAEVANVGDTTIVDLIVDEIPGAAISGFGTDIVYDESVVSLVTVNFNLLLSASGGTLFSFADSLPDTDGAFRIDVGDLSPNHETGPGVLLRLTFEAVGVGSSQVSASDRIEFDNTPNILDGNIVAYPITQVRSGSISVGQTCPSPADLLVRSASIVAPPTATAGQAFDISINSSVVNAGPFGPVNADVSSSLQTPSDCAVSGPNTQTEQGLSLAVSAPVNTSHVFSVTCASASSHAFLAFAMVVADDAVGVESQPANNSLQSSTATTVVTADADLSVGAISLQASQQPNAGMQFLLSAPLTVANAGPYGPTSSAVSATLGVPSDCGVYSPNPGTAAVAVASAGSSNTSISWKVVCDDFGSHLFSVNATVSPNELHVADPFAANSAAGSLTEMVYVGICGSDPAPAGDPLQNISPELLALIGQLTESGSPVPPESSKQLNCDLQVTARDSANTPNNDCPLPLASERPCSLSIDLTIDLPGGSVPDVPSIRLAPVGVTFVPAGFDWANDTEVPNGSPSGQGEFKIRTDASLLPNGIPCVIDISLPPTTAYEGGIQGNVPESNLNEDLVNPNVWPNDLNAERALVEGSFTPFEGAPAGVTLWSRTIAPLGIPGVEVPLNILTWKVTNPAYQALTGAQWIFVPFPGDAVNPDTGGTIGDPQADDRPPATVPTTYCTPHEVNLRFDGMAGGVVFLACKTPGSHMTWNLADPDAQNVTGDEGPRSKVTTCNLDADNDGLSSNSETYWGTNAASNDSDSDGRLDGVDNCKLNANSGQEDFEGDGIGDVCDPDDENDGVADVSDNCPLSGNPGQQNSVHPGTAAGDHCEDFDSDTVLDLTDNCPDDANPAQENDIHPSSTPGDACDDPDTDTVADADDNCPDNTNANQANAVHPATSLGDACDDPDEDAAFDSVDNCPNIANPGQENDDGDPYGNLCDDCPMVINYWSSPPDDVDCDGFASTTQQGVRAPETTIGTDPSDQCADTATLDDERGPAFGEPLSPWPTDINDDGRSNLSDIVRYGAHFNTNAPNPNYSARFDITADNRVNLSDIVAYGPFFNRACS